MSQEDFPDFRIDDNQQDNQPFDMSQYMSNPDSISFTTPNQPVFTEQTIQNQRPQQQFFSSVQSPTPNPTLYKKAKWTAEEDNLLRMLVKKEGTNNWSLIAQSIPDRTGKQCRERWLNQLRPELTKNNWTPQEDAILIHQQQIHGNMWTKIAQFLPGRSPNNVKNRWSWISRHQTTASLFAQMMPFNASQMQNQQMQHPSSPQPQFQQQQNNIHFQQQQISTGLPMTMNLPMMNMNGNAQFSSLGSAPFNNAGMLQTAPPETQWVTSPSCPDIPLITNTNMRRFAFSDPNDQMQVSYPCSSLNTDDSFDPTNANQDTFDFSMLDTNHEDDFNFEFP